VSLSRVPESEGSRSNSTTPIISINMYRCGAFTGPGCWRSMAKGVLGNFLALITHPAGAIERHPGGKGLVEAIIFPAQKTEGAMAGW